MYFRRQNECEGHSCPEGRDELSVTARLCFSMLHQRTVPAGDMPDVPKVRAVCGDYIS